MIHDKGWITVVTAVGFDLLDHCGIYCYYYFFCVTIELGVVLAVVSSIHSLLFMCVCVIIDA